MVSEVFTASYTPVRCAAVGWWYSTCWLVFGLKIFDYEEAEYNGINCHFHLSCNILYYGIGKIKRPVIERGMTKEQVTAALGDPITASFNEFGDSWMYKGWRRPFFVRIYVMFDVAGKVVGYEERTCEPTQKEETSSQVCQNAVPSITQPMYPNGKCCLSDRGFSTLYNKISNASFGDERKI